MMHMRTFCLLLLAAFVGCADDESPQVSNGRKETRQAKPEPVAKDTGITQIQSSYDMWAKIVAAEEKKAKADVNQLTVEQAVRGLDNLITVLQIAIKEDAKASARFRLATMRAELARLGREGNVLLREVQEIETILRDAANNVAPIPSGFTRAELEDNLADVKEARRKHDGRRKAHLKTMAVLEKALQSGKTPEQGETLATRELVAVSALKKRAEALR